MREADWHNLFSVEGLGPSTDFLKKCDVSEAAVFLLSGKEAPNLVDPLDWIILNHWAPQKQSLVKICTWEQI
jgi:hypothetical protein